MGTFLDAGLTSAILFAAVWIGMGTVIALAKAVYSTRGVVVDGAVGAAGAVFVDCRQSVHLCDVSGWCRVLSALAHRLCWALLSGQMAGRGV